MSCKNCLITDMQFDFHLREEEDVSLIAEHFTRRLIPFTNEQLVVRTNEAGAREMLDFSQDFPEFRLRSFRLNKQEWQPIEKLHAILASEWIDEVIQKKSIQCYAQPILDSNENVYAYEILSRFPKEDGSLIFPNEIFNAARLRGRLYALDRLCRMEAVRAAAKLNKKTFINFIPTSIYSPQFCLQSTIRLSKQLNLDPAQLVFEVVETEKVDDVEHLKSILNYYNERGFQYALDDVGAGYSTLEMLGNIKPHFMKLDMEYVQGINSNIEKQQVAIKFLKKAIEIDAVPLAEGIESFEDFDWLRSKGYKLFQGYYFAKPAPVESII